jgi:NAD(P)H-hydrate epimerase
MLATYLDPLFDAAQQRTLDSWAIDGLGIPGRELMETAGTALARRCAQLVPAGTIVAVCGGGNNGGDGLVAARILRLQGREVTVLMTTDPARLRGEAAANFERLPGPQPVPFAAGELADAAGIIDAILGTGFAGAAHEPAAGAIAGINAARRASSGALCVVACDVPSGVDASTGEVQGEAVAADATVTMHAAKPGHWIAPGKHLAGELTIVDIGIPYEHTKAEVEPEIGLITDRVLAEIPRRGTASTKFTVGNVVICGGSRSFTGAPAMAAGSAARAGAGYVTVVVPDSLVALMQVKLLEVMCKGLPEREGQLAPDALAAASTALARADALVLGPGLGRAERTQQFARELAASAPVPLVLDADGLNAHAAATSGLEQLQRRAGRGTVLTPHVGELARLLDTDSRSIEARRLEQARAAARRSGAVVVLKGDDTLIAAPDGRVAVSPGGAPALATAGTGDVLAGVIGALLAKRLSPFDAACAGVLTHVRAGQEAARRVGPDGVIASDVIAALPAALAVARQDGTGEQTPTGHTLTVD